MNRFKKIIEKLGGEDKILHFETCWLIVLVVSLLCINSFGMGQRCALLCSWVLAAAVSFLKEIYDSKHGEVFDWEDIQADGYGVLTGVLTILILS